MLKSLEMKKILAILSAFFFLFSAVFCFAPRPAQAESPVPDVPVISYDGIDYVPVLFTTDYQYISEQFPSVSPGKYYWLVQLRAVGEGAYAKPKNFPGMDLILTSAAGQYLYSSNATSTDAVPPTNVVLFRGADCYNGDDYALELNGRQYSLQNVPDLDSYSADLFTPEPTATPEPKSDLQVALENRLQEFTGRSHPALEEIPSLEGQVYIAVFNSSELLETSDEAARAGEDFYDVPAARLAASPEDADTVLLVYRDYTQVGYYSTGGIALRVYTYVAVIHGESEQRVLVAVNEPPEKITATVGNGGAGEYEPETALRLIAEKLAETP